MNIFNFVFTGGLSEASLNTSTNVSIKENRNHTNSSLSSLSTSAFTNPSSIKKWSL